MYNFIKALHIIFIVTWFAGMFYMPRLFIYNTEALDRPDQEKAILQKQFRVMMTRLWLGITWPSAILTLVLGPWTWYLLGSLPQWLVIKLFFVVGLYLYHFSLHIIYREQIRGVFKYSSQQLRMWNEVATLFLFAIVFLAVIKEGVGALWYTAALAGLALVLMIAIRVYKTIRSRSK
jgi:putative membrane protein